MDWERRAWVIGGTGARRPSGELDRPLDVLAVGHHLLDQSALACPACGGWIEPHDMRPQRQLP